MERIQVSVHCLAYNHENYIKDALESFLMQKTSFNFEVLIHDDASTDATADIIREYERKFPEIIKPIYQRENQHSRHVSIFNTYQLPRMRGRYYAVCEGDDFWTDPFKLQKQFDAMENHPELDICSHKSILINADDKSVIRECTPAPKDCIIPVEKVIEGGGGFVMTSSLFVRKGFEAEYLPFRKEYTFDYSLQIAGALRGGMLYLNDCMSAYRVMSQNSWVRTLSKDPQKRNRHSEYVCLMLEQLNKDTDYKYKRSVNKVVNKNRLKSLVRTAKSVIKH